jgi:cell division septation protein DedD
MFSRLIHYVVFPAVVFGLCVFSYYLGWNRGRQASVTPPGSLSDVPAEAAPHGTTEDLTFFKTLNSEIPPEPSLAEEAKPVQGEAKAGDWVVQVSAFKDVGRAHETIDILKNKGLPAFARHQGKGGAEFHRVYIGPYASRGEADRAARDLVQIGFPGNFVTRLSGR